MGDRYLAHTLRRTTHRSDTVLGVEPTPPDTSAAFGIRPHYAQGRVTTRRDLPPSATARERISCTQSRALSLSPILWALTTTLPSHQHAPACFPQSTAPSTRMRATSSGDQSGNLDFDRLESLAQSSEVRQAREVPSNDACCPRPQHTYTHTHVRTHTLTNTRVHTHIQTHVCTP